VIAVRVLMYQHLPWHGTSLRRADNSSNKVSIARSLYLMGDVQCTILCALGLWAWRDPYQATPDLTRVLRFCGLNQRTAIKVSLRGSWGQWGYILIRIPTGSHGEKAYRYMCIKIEHCVGINGMFLELTLTCKNHNSWSVSCVAEAL
jgi:hypothetical protein